MDVEQTEQNNTGDILRNFAVANQVAQNSRFPNAYVDDVLEKEEIASKVGSIFSRINSVPLAEILFGTGEHKPPTASDELGNQNY